jgi:hypothetical protein
LKQFGTVGYLSTKFTEAISATSKFYGTGRLKLRST